MALPADVCPECGAARPRRAAGCPRCGHIYQDLPAAEPGLPTARAPAAAPAAQLDDPRAEGGAGCGSCLMLGLVLAGLTLAAAVAFYLLVRRDVGDMADSFQREIARQDLGRLGTALEAWAAEHGGRLPESLADVDVDSAWLVDAWDGRIRYEPDDDRRGGRLVSLGADGAPGGAGSAADLERRVRAP